MEIVKYIVEQWINGVWIQTMEGPMSVPLARSTVWDLHRCSTHPVRVVECTPDGLGKIVTIDR